MDVVMVDLLRGAEEMSGDARADEGIRMSDFRRRVAGGGGWIGEFGIEMAGGVLGEEEGTRIKIEGGEKSIEGETG